MTDRPMILEVFTDSEDESNALKQIRAIVKSNDVVIREKASEMAKSVIGRNGVEVIKKILKR